MAGAIPLRLRRREVPDRSHLFRRRGCIRGLQIRRGQPARGGRRRQRLEDAQADPAETLRVLVGPWEEVRTDRSARTLEGGPGQSGVYAKPFRCGVEPAGRWALETLDAEGTATGSSDSAAWVATAQLGEERPTWVVSGSSPAEVGDAAAMLDEETLRDHYAVASFDGGEVFGLPTAGEPAGADAEARCR